MCIQNNLRLKFSHWEIFIMKWSSDCTSLRVHSFRHGTLEETGDDRIRSLYGKIWKREIVRSPSIRSGILVRASQQLLTERLLIMSAETQRPTVIVKLWPSIIEWWQKGASQSGTNSFPLQWASAALLHGVPSTGDQRRTSVFQNKTNLQQSSLKVVRVQTL